MTWRAASAAATRYGAEIVAGLAAASFVSVSAWWTIADTQLPDGDSGKHLVYAYSYAEAIAQGRPLTVLLAWFEYPPLVHAVGAIGALVAGMSETTLVITENLVFVPLLVVGCYGTGRLLGGAWAGALAAVFALAAPMLIGLFHVFMLDTAAAALVAMSTWLLLASKRFASLAYTVCAGVAVAAGFYVKPTFALFIGGLVAVMVVREGRRNWRGVLVFAAVVLVLIEPWYFAHFEEVRTQLQGATAAAQVTYNADAYGSRWSFANLTFYGWILLNSQLYLALFALFIVGAGSAVWALRRRVARDGALPELLVGLLVGYLGISLLALDDPRYTLPLLPYVAVLGTWWIGRLTGLVRAAGATLIVGIFAVNIFIATLGRGPSIEPRIYTPAANPTVAGYVVVLRPQGYTEGAPDRENVGPRIKHLLQNARRDGARNVVFQPESLNVGGLNLWGLTSLAWEADLKVPGFSPNVVGPQDVYMLRGPARGGECIRFGDETGIFLVKGPPIPGWRPYCPPRREGG